jgi:quercetin dioxygenase-like cupin family protein
MDAKFTRKVANPTIGYTLGLALGVVLFAAPIGVWADDLPPGVTMAASDAFAPPAALGTFQAMTFVLDIAPGAGFPEHSHPGRSEVMVIEGVLTEHKSSGEEKVYNPGDAFVEEPGAVHSVANVGKNKVRLVWTLLLPDGKQPIVLQPK